MNENSPAAAPPVQPSLSSRIPSLDILRGIAVLGALFVGIWTFGGFSQQQQNATLLEHRGANHIGYVLIQFLVEGKMRALIALVFGASMVLFLTRENELGRQPADDVFIKRQLWLMVFGVVNAVLFLYPMDFLFHLGIVGILLFPLVRQSKKTLLIAALAATVIYCGKYLWDYSDDKKAYSKYVAVTKVEEKYKQDSIAKVKQGIAAVKKDTLTKQQKKDKEAWTGLAANMKVDTKKDDPTNKAIQSTSYGKAWNQLLQQTQGREAAWTYRRGIWDVGGMMLLGMFLYKIGFFNGRFRSRRYVAIAALGIVGGLLLAWFRMHFQALAFQDYEKYVSKQGLPPYVFYAIERAAMALGYASLVMALLSLHFFEKLFYVFEAAGKLALSNYLLQTLICTLIFNGYGLGYYAHLSQAQLYFIAAEVILVQSVFSVVWLRYFNYGPAEWLLRRLSSGKWLPAKMRKPIVEPSLPVLS